jgi:aconitate hydratase
VERLPFSLKLLLEDLLRTEDGERTTADHVRALAGWDANAQPTTEIQFMPSRVLLQDFTGVPAVVDLAAMREAMTDLGGDPSRINPLVPVELVIDHSVVADVFGVPGALQRNIELEYERNRERYAFLRWGQEALERFRVVPPGTGMVHQVNIEHLARVVFTDVSPDGTKRACPDTLVGTDSHTTMVNGLGVLGWGVGGIGAEAAMLGQPVSMLIPRVVGFKLSGELPDGATATDLVLTITEMLRDHGVVGTFVEFHGPGVAAVPLANRATIGNMSPEYGSTAAIFPIDDETLRYLEFTGRSEHQIALVEAYAKTQGLWHDPSQEADHSELLELDLSTVVASLAGPKRPQDRVNLTDAKRAFRHSLREHAEDHFGELDDAVADTFPASDPSVDAGGENQASDAPHHPTVKEPSGRPSSLFEVTLADGSGYVLDHGHVGIAAITSCTNTSNPSVMIGAGLLAKSAVEAGLRRRPWVKTSLAPGSKVVTDYYDHAGLTPYLDELGFNLVGYGCTTCIGNSGPLIPEAAQAVKENDLAVTSVLSGNRNFEGRINPQVKMNDLASPPLVVAYALAGSMDIDLTNEPLGTGTDGQAVYLSDIWPSPQQIQATIDESVRSAMFVEEYASVFEGDEHWTSLPTPTGDTFAWDQASTYIHKPPFFDRMPAEPEPVEDIAGARVLAKARRLGHHRPHLPCRSHRLRQPSWPVPVRSRRRDPGLQLLRLPPRQPPGDVARHLRQPPPAQPARARNRRRLHPRLHRRRADHHDLRSRPELPGGPHAARRARRQRVRLGLIEGLGRQRNRAARNPRRHRHLLRTHPPLQPHRDGGPTPAVPRRHGCGITRAHRRRDLRRLRCHCPERRRRAGNRLGHRTRRGRDRLLRRAPTH